MFEQRSSIRNQILQSMNIESRTDLNIMVDLALELTQEDTGIYLPNQAIALLQKVQYMTPNVNIQFTNESVSERAYEVLDYVAYHLFSVNHHTLLEENVIAVLYDGLKFFEILDVDMNNASMMAFTMLMYYQMMYLLQG